MRASIGCVPTRSVVEPGAAGLTRRQQADASNVLENQS